VSAELAHTLQQMQCRGSGDTELDIGERKAAVVYMRMKPTTEVLFKHESNKCQNECVLRFFRRHVSAHHYKAQDRRTTSMLPLDKKRITYGLLGLWVALC
jgi:hypothetical protein